MGSFRDIVNPSNNLRDHFYCADTTIRVLAILLPHHRISVNQMEWCTSSSNLLPHLLLPSNPLILDLGCGTSTLSIDLLNNIPSGNGRLILVDYNATELPETNEDERVAFANVNLLESTVVIPKGTLDENVVLIDKSTLDYILTLGPSSVTSYFLKNILNNLGIYYCVSYHDPQFLSPILEGCFESVEVITINREDGKNTVDSLEEVNYKYNDSGSFDPNEEYFKKCYLYTCRGTGSWYDDNSIERKMKEHLDVYYQQQNSMIKDSRRIEIEECFGGEIKGLKECWRIMFDEGLREVYDFELFKEEVWEWHGEEVQGMGIEEVVEFLRVMQ